jgi:hypothetical protein
MSDDDWDDWENAEIIIPTINVLNQEQLKRIEERKLIEEADTELSKELFSDATSYKKILNIDKNNIVIYKNTPLTKENIEAKLKKLQNKKDNELKQQEFSKKIREEKLKKQIEIELYGEPEEIYEHDEYDSLYNS